MSNRKLSQYLPQYLGYLVVTTIVLVLAFLLPNLVAMAHDNITSKQVEHQEISSPVLDTSTNDSANNTVNSDELLHILDFASKSYMTVELGRWHGGTPLAMSDTAGDLSPYETDESPNAATSDLDDSELDLYPPDDSNYNSSERPNANMGYYPEANSYAETHFQTILEFGAGFRDSGIDLLSPENAIEYQAVLFFAQTFESDEQRLLWAYMLYDHTNGTYTVAVIDNNTGLILSVASNYVFLHDMHPKTWSAALAQCYGDTFDKFNTDIKVSLADDGETLHFSSTARSVNCPIFSDIRFISFNSLAAVLYEFGANGN
jgi:hypothetical protein